MSLQIDSFLLCSDFLVFLFHNLPRKKRPAEAKRMLIYFSLIPYYHIMSGNCGNVNLSENSNLNLKANASDLTWKNLFIEDITLSNGSTITITNGTIGNYKELLITSGTVFNALLGNNVRIRAIHGRLICCQHFINPMYIINAQIMVCQLFTDLKLTVDNSSNFFFQGRGIINSIVVYFIGI